MLMQHQELVDGSGYPNHLAAQDISDGAKIIAIVHTFEELPMGTPVPHYTSDL